MKSLKNIKLEEKLNLLKQMADDLPVPIIIHQIPEYAIIYMNKVGLDILGVGLAELQSIEPSEYVSRYFNMEDYEEDSVKVYQNLEHVSGRPAAYFQQVKSKDGNWRLYASNTAVFFTNENGEVSHLVTTASPLDPEHHINVKINRLLDDVRFLRNNAMVFGKLSAREVEVLKLMALGLSSTEISEKLFIALATVDTHRRNIRQKLSLKNNYDAVKFAHAFNLV